MMLAVPTANFRHPSCAKQLKVGVCRDRQCLFPKPCPNLDADHSDYIALLQKVRALSGIKKVFVRSGIRYDYLLADKNDRFLDELCRYHVSGQLKVAPEHVAEHALSNMGKPGKSVYLKFMRAFNKKNQEIGLKQFLVPYFISSHPGCTLRDAVELSEFLRDIGHQPEQVRILFQLQEAHRQQCIIPVSILKLAKRFLLPVILMIKRCSVL